MAQVHTDSLVTGLSQGIIEGSRNLQLFREKIQAYMRLSRNSQIELAEELGLHPKVLSRKLSPNSTALLTIPEVKQVVKALAKWSSILTQDEAQELLLLMNCPPFTPEEWLAPPLNRLEESESASTAFPLSLSHQSNRSDEDSDTGRESFPDITPILCNLPTALTSFVGRKREMAEIKEWLIPPGGKNRARLVTLTGTGGSGKTRLALEVASTLLGDFKGGVWLVELASVTNPAFISQYIAEALGVNEQSNRPLLTTLTNSLKNRQLLLVLDNCEHLIDDCAHVVSILLRSCPGLQVLATSREALRLTGERVYRIPALALPNLKHLPEVKCLAEYDAIRLFIERAEVVNPNFAVTAQNATVLVELCEKLDGIPLAIELAAARTQMLTIEQINKRLADRFGLLKSAGNRAEQPRQQTLSNLIEWSYNLLNEQERLLFRRLAVFLGGFTLEAAEEVGSDELLSPIEVVDVLSQLVNKSLVLVEEERDSRLRYRYLETIRHYAFGRLVESPEQEQQHQKHFSYFLSLAEDAYTNGNGAQQLAWLERLDREHDNFRTALDWAKKSGNLEGIIHLSGALGWFWYVRGHNSEGRGWLEAALNNTELQPEPQNKQALARAYQWAATLMMMQADFSQATLYYEKSLALSRKLNDTRNITETLNRLGELARDQGDFQRADTLLKESLVLARQLNDLERAAHILCDLGEIAWDQGGYSQARIYYQQSYDLATLIENHGYIGKASLRLGQGDRVQGNYIQASARFRECMSLFQQQGNQWGIAVSFHRQGLVAFDLGQFDSARSLFEQSLAVFRQSGDQWGIAEQIEELGNLAMARADLETARSLFEQSLPLYRKLGIKLQIANSLISQAELALWQNNLPLAKERLQEGLALHRERAARPGIARALRLMAEVALREEAYEKALSLFNESLQLSRQMDEKLNIAICLESKASLALAMRQPEEAVKLLGTARAIRETIGTPLWPLAKPTYERLLECAREGTGEERFEELWQEGYQSVPGELELEIKNENSSRQ
ncbi:MAG TPA: tetratricopeptide repeat protein [Chloroflexia bacterium]|nr:tetratricopeptide repeat protein [Chloroflexia bacterium]